MIIQKWLLLGFIDHAKIQGGKAIIEERWVESLTTARASSAFLLELLHSPIQGIQVFLEQQDL